MINRTSPKMVPVPITLRYAQRWNRRHRQSGRLFEGRFYSTPLDDRHIWAVVGYIERNPVRARLVPRAEQWPWTYARAQSRPRSTAHEQGKPMGEEIDLFGRT